ncbi:nickel-binding accessory protein UreJ-HupE [Geminocystis sp. NIES-3708]|uniref:HupE/UreJ family protein n=1 Tax=Geminocystis sp. NIES-3708 TaxID=1615909 RepID=UPI0005FCC73A|nr:HupE/UreJ family protein [Geminocystis sp. NIES-3708]BAQ59676.1 nickel-binding accessory protein UreJ-HupE [Geminocystis sp. NIES-3708]
MISVALVSYNTENILPDNFYTGLMAGLAHPIIALNHLTFIIGVGLLGSLCSWGIIIAVVFVLTSILGTFVNLMSINLPVPELIISLSVSTIGLMLAKSKLPKNFTAITLTLIAGIFHGYSYGESIIGAKNTPLFAYITGFVSIQVIVIFCYYKFSKLWQNKSSDNSSPSSSLIVRLIGCGIFGMGITFMSNFLGA